MPSTTPFAWVTLPRRRSAEHRLPRRKPPIRQPSLAAAQSPVNRCSREQRRWWGVWLGLVVLGPLVGCGGTAATPSAGPPSEKTVAKAAGKRAASGTTPSESPATSGSKFVRVDVDGRKWIGDIPYDVFLDDPLAVVSNTQVVSRTPAVASSGSESTGGATSAASSSPAATGKPASEPGTAGGTDWKSLASIEQLQEETKRIRNHLTQALQSQGTYNGNYKELQVDGAVLAAIASVVAEHDETISWKHNARFVRMFGKQLNEAARALGKDAYTKSQAAGQNIIAVLDGNVPADAGDPPPKQPLAEAIDRIGLMYRMQKAKDWMKLEVNTESKFKAELDKVQKEATLVALFGAIVADPSYDYADEDDYKQFVRELINGGKEAAAAAQDQSYPQFNDAINKMQKACDQCHGIYGNG